jgi:hypothetical protein
MSARSRIKGPRFALRSPENCRACIKCVYGNGEHAAWCPLAPRAETPVQRETEKAEEQKGMEA